MIITRTCTACLEVVPLGYMGRGATSGDGGGCLHPGYTVERTPEEGDEE